MRRISRQGGGEETDEVHKKENEEKEKEIVKIF